MARAFSGTAQYLDRAATLVSYPFSVVGWVRTAASTDQTIWAEESTANNQEQFIVQVVATTRTLRLWAKAGGSANTCTTSAALALNTWGHMAAVCAAFNDRKIYLNGGNVGSDAGTAHVGTRAYTQLGRLWNGGSPTWLLNGALSEFAIYSAALTADEVVALSKGYSPLLIRPQSLVGYWPLFGNDSPEPDRWKSSLDLTVNSATKAADHSPIIQPVGSF